MFDDDFRKVNSLLFVESDPFGWCPKMDNHLAIFVGNTHLKLPLVGWVNAPHWKITRWSQPIFGLDTRNEFFNVPSLLAIQFLSVMSHNISFVDSIYLPHHPASSAKQAGSRCLFLICIVFSFTVG